MNYLFANTERPAGIAPAPEPIREAGPMESYTVTLTAAELASVREHLGRPIVGKKVAVRKTAAVAAPFIVTVFSGRPVRVHGYGTTTPELDAWLDARHSDAWKYKPKTFPKTGPARLSESARKRETASWASAARAA